MELLVYPAIYYLWRSRPFKNHPASAAIATASAAQ
jgi:hypothetical protein